MKVKILNIRLKYYKPKHTGSVKRISGTVMQVKCRINNRLQQFNIQYEQRTNGSMTFYDPNWQFSDTNLKRLIRKIAQWELEYEQIWKEENAEFERRNSMLDPEREDDQISIPDWL